MTLREIFLRLRKLYFRDPTRPFPVYLNLRDHWAQQNPVEALERHAREIGYPDERQLVMAWRAGFITLILDGFDEVAAAGWAGSGERLVQLRQRAMIMIRRFVSESPADMTLIIAGRSHYFDTDREMQRALGTGSDALYLTLNDFSAEQVARYLHKQGYEGQIPDWLPSRPLLIGHLAQRGMLQGLITGKDSDLNAAEGWRLLRTMICEREASIEEANILADQLQRVLERIATIARSQPDGLGPIDSIAIFDAFREVMGQPPDDAAQVLLLRIPGLGAYSGSDTGSRSFIDEDLADVFRAGDVVRFCDEPYSRADAGELWSATKSLGDLGISVAALDCVAGRRMSAALREAAKRDTGGVIAFDIYRLLCAKGLDYEGKEAEIRDTIIEEMEIYEDMPSMQEIRFYNCLIDELSIDETISNKYPRFVNCIIHKVVGRVSLKDLPSDLLDQASKVEEFSSFDRTTSSIMRARLSPSIKVMLTVLKKLFLQPGSGRQERALYRGLKQEARDLVRPVLEIMESEALAKPVVLNRRTVWIPARSQYGRVLKILEAPSESRDGLVQRCAGLGERG
jgi:hypothetical protein